MNNSFLIQSLKSQVENIKLQMDNIDMQNNNMSMMNNPIGEQLLNLSIQMFNAGIQAYNIGKSFNDIMNTNKYYEQLAKISKQINDVIISEQQIMIQQNMMQQQMMQQQMMQQQMMQQQMMQQQMMQQQMMQQQMKKIIFINNSTGVKTHMESKVGITMEELFNRYKNEVYGETNKKLTYIYISKKINRDDKRKLEDVFKLDDSPEILVIESGFIPK